jgi:hypothetical protein
MEPTLPEGICFVDKKEASAVLPLLGPAASVLAHSAGCQHPAPSLPQVKQDVSGHKKYIKFFLIDQSGAEHLAAVAEDMGDAHYKYHNTKAFARFGVLETHQRKDLLMWLEMIIKETSPAQEQEAGERPRRLLPWAAGPAARMLQRVRPAPRSASAPHTATPQPSRSRAARAACSTWATARPRSTTTTGAAATSSS